MKIEIFSFIDKVVKMQAGCVLESNLYKACTQITPSQDIKCTLYDQTKAF